MNTLTQPPTFNLNALEIELLLYCCRTNLNRQVSERIKAIARLQVDWESFLEIANTHQVIQIVYQNLSNTCADFLPQDISDRLKSAYHTNALHNTYLTQELLKLLELFKTHNIDVVSFKGPALAVSAYGDLELRQYQDLDFLVKESKFLTATDLLISCGYELNVQVPWEHHLDKNELLSVDLHQRFAPQHLSCALNADYIWSNLDYLTLGDRQIEILSPEVELLMLCLNGTKECWRSFNRICDVSALLSNHPQLNWSGIMQHANDNGFKRMLFLGILLAKTLLETDIPPAIWQQIQSDSEVKSLSEEVREQLFAITPEKVGEIERTVFHIRTRERWREKIQSLIGIISFSGWFTPSENDRGFIWLPTFLEFLYYLIRPIRIVKKYGLNTLKRLFFFS